MCTCSDPSWSSGNLNQGPRGWEHQPDQWDPGTASMALPFVHHAAGTRGSFTVPCKYIHRNQRPLRAATSPSGYLFLPLRGQYTSAAT
jgi:hypothetical protein